MSRTTTIARDLATPPPDTLLELARDIVYFADQAGMADDNWRHRLGKLRKIMAAQGVERAQPVEPKTCAYCNRPGKLTSLGWIHDDNGLYTCPAAQPVEGVTDDAPARVEPLHEGIERVCPRCKIGIDTDGDGHCAYCARLTDEDLKKRLTPAAQPAKHTDEEAAFKIAVQAVDVPYYEDRHGDVYVLARGFLALRGRAETRIEVLEAALNSPETDDFFKGIESEAAHQRLRWPSEHDAGKSHADWFWLVGYLAGKCLQSALAGNIEKALHHTISTAAALANWHRAIKGTGNMRPGIATPLEDAARADIAPSPESGVADQHGQDVEEKTE